MKTFFSSMIILNFYSSFDERFYKRSIS